MENLATKNDVKIWYLKNFDFFGELCNKRMELVKNHTSMRNFRPKEIIYMSGGEENIYLLKKGQVKISRLTSDGEEIIQDILAVGEIFGALPMSQDFDSNEMEYAQAANETVVCIMRKQSFEQLLEMYPNLHQRLTKWYGIRMRRYKERLNDLIFKDVKKRIAGFLLRYDRDFGKEVNEGYEVKPMLTHEEIGLLTGAARQTVTSVLNDFKQEG